MYVDLGGFKWMYVDSGGCGLIEVDFRLLSGPMIMERWSDDHGAPGGVL